MAESCKLMAKEDIYRYVLEAPEYGPDWHWITDDIALGSYPLDPALESILASGITAILSLRMDDPDYDLARFERHHVCTVEDLQPFPYDILVGAIRFLHCAVRDGHKVYVHCFAGISRSPFVVACYLMLARNITFEDALAVVQNEREVVSPSPALYHGGILDRLIADRDTILTC